MNKAVVAVIGAAAVVALVALIIAVSLVPLPEFVELSPSRFGGSLAYVDEDNCVEVADLEAATVTELRCEPDQGWIDELAWTDAGIEVTAYLNQPTTRVLDPRTGEVIDTVVGDEVISEPPSEALGLVVDRPEDEVVVIYDEEDDVLLRLQAPQRYWIDYATPQPDGDLVSIIDSVGRLAVFDRVEARPYLVAEDARSWPSPSWEP